MQVQFKLYGKTTYMFHESPFEFFRVVSDLESPKASIAIRHDDGTLIIGHDFEKLNRYNYLHNRINERAIIADLVAQNREGNKVWVQTGGYDRVDNVRWADEPKQVDADTYCIKANRFALGLAIGDIECSYWEHILSAEQAAQAEAEHRDLALEAFEDGHPYSIYS